MAKRADTSTFLALGMASSDVVLAAVSPLPPAKSNFTSNFFLPPSATGAAAGVSTAATAGLVLTENNAFTSTFLPTVAETFVAGVVNVGAGGRGKVVAAAGAAVDAGTDTAGGIGGVTNVGGGVAVTTGSAGAVNVGATGNDVSNCDTLTFFAVAGTLLDAASVEGAAVAAAAGAAGAASVFLLIAAFALRNNEFRLLLPPVAAGAAATAGVAVDSTGAVTTGAEAGAAAAAGAAVVGAFSIAVNLLAADCRSGATVSAFETVESSATDAAGFTSPTGFAASAKVRRGKIVTLPGSVAEGDDGAFFSVRPSFCFSVSDEVVDLVAAGTDAGAAAADDVAASDEGFEGAVSRFFNAVAFDAFALSFFWSTAGAAVAEGGVAVVGAALFA